MIYTTYAIELGTYYINFNHYTNMLILTSSNLIDIDASFGSQHALDNDYTIIMMDSNKENYD